MSRRVTGGNEQQLLKCSPPTTVLLIQEAIAIPSRPSSALRATQRKNRIRKSYVMTFQIKPPGQYVHVVLSVFCKWPWIFVEFSGLPRWKNLFLCFPLFFSSFYCVDVFISFVLRHLWVKKCFALRMSWSLRIVRVTLKFIIQEKMRFINLELRERITEQRLKWVPATIQEQTRIEV